MKPLNRMTNDELLDVINNAGELGDEIIDEAYDELERRERAEELRDWDEQDRRAAQEERIDLWRREY